MSNVNSMLSRVSAKMMMAQNGKPPTVVADEKTTIANGTMKVDTEHIKADYVDVC